MEVQLHRDSVSRRFDWSALRGGGLVEWARDGGARFVDGSVPRSALRGGGLVEWDRDGIAPDNLERITRSAIRATQAAATRNDALIPGISKRDEDAALVSAIVEAGTVADIQCELLRFGTTPAKRGWRAWFLENGCEPADRLKKVDFASALVTVLRRARDSDASARARLVEIEAAAAELATRSAPRVARDGVHAALRTERRALRRADLDVATARDKARARALRATAMRDSYEEWWQETPRTERWRGAKMDVGSGAPVEDAERGVRGGWLAWWRKKASALPRLPGDVRTGIATYLSDPVSFAVARASAIKDEDAAMRATGCISAYNEWLVTVPRPPRWLGVDMEMNTGEPRPSPVMGWGAFVVTRARRARLLRRGPSVHKRTLEGHTDYVNALAALPGGKLASGSHDRTIRIWDVATGECVCTLKGHAGSVFALAALPGGKLASGGDDSTIKIWDVAERECKHTLQDSDWVRALVALPGGKLASGAFNDGIKIWDVATGEYCTLKDHTSDSAGFLDVLVALPDGKLASASQFDNIIKIWNVATRKSERTMAIKARSVHSLAALPDGKLASGANDGSIESWDVADGKCEYMLKDHTHAVMALAAWPGGKLASGAIDSTIKIRNVATGQCERTLEGHTGAVIALTALPDGKLASGSRDQTIKIWGDE